MHARQESQGIELYEENEECENDSERRSSLNLDDLKKAGSAHLRSTYRHRNGGRPPPTDSLEFSSSRVSYGPGSLKEMSTGTMSTLSTLDGEEAINFSGTSIVLK